MHKQNYEQTWCFVKRIFVRKHHRQTIRRLVLDVVVFTINCSGYTSLEPKHGKLLSNLRITKWNSILYAINV